MKNKRKTKIVIFILSIPAITFIVYSCVKLASFYMAKDESFIEYGAIGVDLCNIANIEFENTLVSNSPRASIDTLSPSISQEGYTILDCKVIYQLPSLPNGCEITATTIVLQYLGYTVSKEEMSDKYLDKGYPYQYVDPNVAFMGNPRSSDAWYCFPPVIVKAVNKYFNENNYTKHVAKDCTNSELLELREYIYKGYPIICWATARWEPIIYNYTFYLKNGELTYSNLHCLVISGYFVENGVRYYQITDPARGIYNITEATLQRVYNAMGRKCVVITENK